MELVNFNAKVLEGKKLLGVGVTQKTLTVKVEGATVTFYHEQDEFEDVFIFNSEKVELEKYVGEKVAGFSFSRVVKDYSKELKGTEYASDADDATETTLIFSFGEKKKKKKIKVIFLGIAGGYYNTDIYFSLED